MRYRTLGRTGIEVSEIGYGAWGIGGKQWLGGEDSESLRALRRAIDLGLNFIDTALAYGDGHSEQLVGEVVGDAVRTGLARIYVATKVPPQNRLWPARPGIPIGEVFPYDYIVACTEESLRNLKLEAIDLQQLHVWNPEWINNDDWKRAFEDLKRAGKVKHVGMSISDHLPDTALELVRTGLIDTIQVIYNIFDQSPQQNLLPLAQERGVGILARVPLDEGGLTGTITESTTFDKNDFRSWYFRGDRKREVVEHVNALKHDLEGTSPAETALRFCLSNPAVSTVIPGMRRVSSVESNIAASDAGPLEPATLQMLKRHAWPRNFYN
jgi:aryl-alcohol dehydrogenase-like predicted oxidoreductase